MPALTDNSRAPYNPDEKVHYPFKAVYRVSVSHDGRRWSAIRELEKIANFVELDLLNANWNIATPVRFIPQFGTRSARIEITGFADPVALSNSRLSTSNVNKIATGVVQGDRTGIVSGQPGGGNLSFAQDPTARVDNDVTGMIVNLEADSSILGGATYGAELEVLEYNGIKYGRDGRSFPTTIAKA